MAYRPSGNKVHSKYQVSVLHQLRGKKAAGRLFCVLHRVTFLQVLGWTLLRLCISFSGSFAFCEVKASLVWVPFPQHIWNLALSLANFQPWCIRVCWAEHTARVWAEGLHCNCRALGLELLKTAYTPQAWGAISLPTYSVIWYQDFHLYENMLNSYISVSSK